MVSGEPTGAGAVAGAEMTDVGGVCPYWRRPRSDRSGACRLSAHVGKQVHRGLLDGDVGGIGRTVCGVIVVQAPGPLDGARAEYEGAAGRPV